MRTYHEIVGHIQLVIEDVSLGKLPAESVNEDDRLISDLGLDSLDYATVFLECESWLGIHIREDVVDWSQITTISQIAILLMQEQ